MRSILLIPFACFLSSCDQNLTEEVVSPSEPETPACCSEEAPEAVEASEDSIYQLDSKWRNAAGDEKDLSSLGGNIQVVSMGYTTCQFACPRLLADMREIESGLSGEARGKTRFTFISIDPDRDTPEQLARYREENELDPARWNFLTGDSGSVQELAVVLGIQYRKVSDTDFAHSNVITVLNDKGEVIYRQEGLAGDPKPTVEAIVAAAQ